MCGRYSLDATADEIVEAFDLAAAIAFQPRYNIAPTQPAPIVRIGREAQARRAVMMRWGLETRFTDRGRALINLRGETAAGKPLFRDAMRKRRCLVPATGFYEWQKLGRARQPFHVGVASGGLLAFAGVWDRYVPEGGGDVEAFVILTTRANALVAPIHDRMPVILEPSAWNRWLAPDVDDPALLEDLLAPAPESLLEAHPVSTLVNSPANDVAECTRPLDATGKARDGAGEPWLWEEPPAPETRNP